jgi:molybdopterin molybdotransferase
MTLPLIDGIDAKIDRLRHQLRVVSTEAVPIEHAMGRILASPVAAFRDSPALDVSAMDGYAMRLKDADIESLPVSGTACAGSPPLFCPPGQSIRIFTGAAVPDGAELVIPREQCHEDPDRVRVTTPTSALKAGQNIRRQGENARRGDVILLAGGVIHAPAISSLVSFCEHDQVEVRRTVRIAIINTGDELMEPGVAISDWQIRDSNGPLIVAMLAQHSWANTTRNQVPDDPQRVRSILGEALTSSDAVILTGGVSMGDTDHVPNAIIDCGGHIVFHRIPIRPGKPLLGAVGPEGQLIMGLPGNPVSVAVTFRRYALELLRHVAGMQPLRQTTCTVPVSCADKKTIDLLWFRIVKLDTNGTAVILPNQGSGDIASLGNSDGFVEIPPGVGSSGHFPFYAWMS